MNKRIVAAAFAAILFFAVCACAGAEGFKTLDSLAGEKIGVTTGSIFDDIATERWPDCSLVFLDATSDMALNLINGNVAAVLLDKPVAMLMISGVDGLGIIPEQLQPDNYAAVFPKTEKGAKLRDEFNFFLSEARQSGLYDELNGIWFGTDDDKRITGDPSALPATNGVIINLATNSESEPFDYIKNGKVTGFEIDLMLRFCEKHGYGLTLNDMNFSAVIPGIASEKYDMALACISITEERAESVYFSDPIYEGGVVAIVRAVAPTGASAATSFWDGLVLSFEKNFIREDRWLMIVSGICVTLFISIGASLLGIIIGFGLCLLRISRNRPVNGVSHGFIRVIQGTPVVVLLMILYYVVFNRAGLSGVAVAIIAFGVNFGAYSAEIFRSGINGVDPGQREAAAAIGFSRAKTFVKIVFPQAAISFLPVLKGEFISLVKTTSIVGYVAVQDLTKVSDIIRSRTYDAFFPLIATAVIYFLLSVALSSLLNLIEIRIDPKRRKRVLKGVTLRQ